MNASVAVPCQYRLRLIVAGGTHRSRRAIEALRSVCNKRLAGLVDLEVIDIYQLPEMAREYQVIAAPTLLKLLPLPVRRIIGDLSDSEQLLRILELPSVPRS
jgi:circadian clock protein KaiB